VDPYDASVARAPELTSVAMTSTVQLPLSDTDVASLGGALLNSKIATGGFLDVPTTGSA